uniref:Uncharacterized protein n=1 Tax=Anopheles albimanus TaxID=7167 RepID=A0A182FXV1_ANOAL
MNCSTGLRLDTRPEGRNRC